MHSYTATQLVVPIISPLPPMPPPATNSSTPETAQTQSIDCLSGNHATRGVASSLPDHEPDQFEWKGKAIAIAKGQQGNKWTLFFVGSLEPLLLAHRQKRRRRRSASLYGNVDNPGEDGEEDEDADADEDTDYGDGEAYGRERSWCRLSSSLSRMWSQRWRRSGRGSRRRSWSVLLVLRRYWDLRLSCVRKEKHNGRLNYETTIITCTICSHLSRV